jgi:hypothetical protein
MMRAARIAIVALSVLSLASAGFAQDLQTSITQAAKAQAAQTQATTPAPAGGSRTTLWAGSALVAAGMGMTLWGLLHTSDGRYTTPIDLGKVSSPGLVGGGLAVVAGGGALLFLGSRHSSASVAIGRGIAVSKQVSW